MKTQYPNHSGPKRKGKRKDNTSIKKEIRAKSESNYLCLQYEINFLLVQIGITSIALLSITLRLMTIKLKNMLNSSVKKINSDPREKKILIKIIN